jgi:hypothetical protein
MSPRSYHHFSKGVFSISLLSFSSYSPFPPEIKDLLRTSRRGRPFVLWMAESYTHSSPSHACKKIENIPNPRSPPPAPVSESLPPMPLPPSLPPPPPPALAILSPTRRARVRRCGSCHATPGCRPCSRVLRAGGWNLCSTSIKSRRGRTGMLACLKN